MKNQLERASRWLAEADAVLIGAGAGLSADAGFDYTDPVAFARNYPAMLQYGFKKKTDLMGWNRLPPELEWGYYLSNVKEVRFCDPPQRVYRRLLDLVREKDHFVITTNADALFEKNGFATDRIHTPQGDYCRWQCLRPCSTATWRTEALLEKYLPSIDPATQRLPKGNYPTCPRCGGPAFLNVRGGDWFIDEPYREGAARFAEWIETRAGAKLLVLDIGSGFNTPTWIRWPSERLVRANPRAHLVRINLHDPQVPDEIAGRSACFATRAGEVIFPLADGIAAG